MLYSSVSYYEKDSSNNKCKSDEFFYYNNRASENIEMCIRYIKCVGTEKLYRREFDVSPEQIV